MRVLIDACLPVKFKSHLGLVNATTVRERGWQHKKNGELLEVAQHEFDVLVTMDKRMPDQQRLSRYSIAVVILRARSNRLADLIPLTSKLLQALEEAKKGCALEIG